MYVLVRPPTGRHAPLQHMRIHPTGHLQRTMRTLTENQKRSMQGSEHRFLGKCRVHFTVDVGGVRACTVSRVLYAAL